MRPDSTGPLLACQGLCKSFGAQVLFENVSLNLGKGDRVGLIGPNGSGKSTLLKILAGLETPDAGTRSVRRLARLGLVPQECAFDPDATVEDLIAQALDAALARVNVPDPESERDARFSGAIGTGAFPDRRQKAGDLSGGWTRRLAIAMALAAKPDVLLLDEPTNHLDLEGLAWLEKLLLKGSFATIVVSHDRSFLEAVATRMVELNRVYPDGALSVRGNYSEFLTRREEFLRDQAQQRDALANKVRREVEWLRRGPKARATKAKSRVDKAHRLMDELAGVTERSATRTASIDFSSTGRRTKRLLATRGIEKALGGRPLFSKLDLVLSPGMRVGLAGANGTGKTTLLRVLAGEIEPDAGTVEFAPGLRVVYFDQKRERIDLGASLRRALSPDGDQVVYRGRPIHVAGWARRFLFEPDQLETPVGDLSGGERARLLIANLVLRPADLLLLDEPTNDLDIPTLDVLEESIGDFPGAVVLVTHDRYLMDRATEVLVCLDGKGGAEAYADLAQWEATSSGDKERQSPRENGGRKPRARRLSYLEQRELEGIENRILEAEKALADRVGELEDPRIVSDFVQLMARGEAAATARSLVDSLYERWAQLEAKVRSAQVAGTG